MKTCPSELALERHLLAPDAAVAGHLAACARCAGRLAALEREGDVFRREVFPVTVDAVAAAGERAFPADRSAGPAPRGRRAARSPGRFSGWWLAVPLAAAAAVAVALIVPRSRPGLDGRLAPASDYVGVKGGALGLAVYVGDAGGAHAVGEGDRVPATAALRFQVRPAAPCRLWLLSVDASGQVSRLYPTGGDGGAPVSARAPEALPGGAVLDGQPGPERLYAVCTPGPLSWSEVERSAQAVGAGAAAVRARAELRGLPPGTAQATVLLEKRP